jgi:lysosomal Pro-X carboxypeptidase
VAIAGVIFLIQFQSTSKSFDNQQKVNVIDPLSHSSSSWKANFKADASNCSTNWIDQKIDHFNWLPSATNTSQPATYKQRFLVNDQYWNSYARKAPIFFYCGNEGDVTLYANHTGLMWENAQAFNALIVFAEHRYYGESKPFGGDLKQEHLAYLSHEQALADYTHLIFHLQETYDAKNHPVIVFGGSYGGMLASWFRMKYPSIVQGAIAASAPIFGFPGYPSFQGTEYWRVVTRNAQPVAGSSKNCVPNVSRSWKKIFDLASTVEGRAQLTNIFRLCDPLTDKSQAEDLAMFILVAFDTLAMGNFPYPSSYLTSGVSDLPAWPVREACRYLADDFEENDQVKLLEALRDAANVYNNASKDFECFKLPKLTSFDGIWDYQWCTQMLPQETYFDSNGETDMFWPRQITQEQINARCQEIWHTRPDPKWIRVSYGDEKLRGASNIVFSNGLLDPWSSGGVKTIPRDSNVILITIEEGAHHLDLFFSHPKDPPSVIKARQIEIQQIQKWIEEYVHYTYLT